MDELIYIFPQYVIINEYDVMLTKLDYC